MEILVRICLKIRLKIRAKTRRKQGRERSRPVEPAQPQCHLPLGGKCGLPVKRVVWTPSSSGGLGCSQSPGPTLGDWG